MKVFIVFLVLLLGLSLILPHGEATTDTQTRYLESYATQFSTMDATYYFGLRNLTVYDVFDFYYKNYSGSYDGRVRVGFRVYRNIYDSDYLSTLAYEELTSGFTQLWEGNHTFEGWVSTSWTCPELNLSRLDYLQVNFYARFQIAGGGYSSASIFNTDFGASGNTVILMTESLGMDKLLSSDWNFTVYLKCFRETSPTYKRVARIYVGNSTYDSHISNMQFDDGIILEAEPFTEGIFLGAIVLGALGFFGFLFLLVKKHT